jgi:LPXTG-site transpeptidase (sortase) family protein
MNSTGTNRKYLTPLLIAGFFLIALTAIPFALRSRTITVGAPENDASALLVNVAAPEVALGTASASSDPSAQVVVANDSGAGTVAPTGAANNTLPARLLIPKLGIKSNIQYVGLTPKGAMDIPHSAVDTAWYKLGPRPGEVGSAVINGHVNTYYSDHGVFEHLGDLVPGDIVMVEQKNGNVLHFKVIGKKIFAHDAPGDEVFAPTSGRHLNLITCTGTWMKDKQIYDERLVVFTELVL